jgi:hypothetical protein
VLLLLLPAMLLQPDGSKEVYDGPLKAPQLRTFLDGHATQEPLPDTGGEAAAASRINDPLAAFNEVVVHALTPVNLTDIDAQTDMWLIGFYAAGVGVGEQEGGRSMFGLPAWCQAAIEHRLTGATRLHHRCR